MANRNTKAKRKSADSTINGGYKVKRGHPINSSAERRASGKAPYNPKRAVRQASSN